MDLNHKIQLKTVLLIKSDTIVSKDMPLVSYHWMYISLHYPSSISRPDNGHLKSAVCYLSMQDRFSKTVHVFGEILWRNADTAFKMNIFLSVLLSDPVVMICDTVPIVQCYLIGKIMRPFFNSLSFKSKISQTVKSLQQSVWQSWLNCVTKSVKSLQQSVWQSWLNCVTKTGLCFMKESCCCHKPFSQWQHSFQMKAELPLAERLVLEHHFRKNGVSSAGIISLYPGAHVEGINV